MDTDGDGVPDAVDNCIEVVNANQLDADADVDGEVTVADYAMLRSVLGQPATASPTAAAADLNGSGTVTVADFAILRARLGTAPGPSGIAP